MLFKLAMLPALTPLVSALFAGKPVQNLVEEIKHPLISPPFDKRAISDALKKSLPKHGYTVSHWPRGLITQNCYDVATRHGVSPAHFMVHEVEYDDCKGAPWIFCIDDSAPESVGITTNRTDYPTGSGFMRDRGVIFETFGQMPVGMRSFSPEMIGIEKLGVIYELPNDSTNFLEGILRDQNTILAYAVPHNNYTVITGGHWETGILAHELTHLMDHSIVTDDDGKDLSDTEIWQDTVKLDAVLPTPYSATNWAESLGEIGRLSLYDMHFRSKGGLEAIHGNTTKLIGHQLLTFRTQFEKAIYPDRHVKAPHRNGTMPHCVAKWKSSPAVRVPIDHLNHFLPEAGSPSFPNGVATAAGVMSMVRSDALVVVATFIALCAALL